MITLYGSGQSRSFRALWALEEAALNYEYIAMDREPGDEPRHLHSDAYARINSQHKVPTLVDGEIVLTESAAIVNYLALLSDGDLMPSTPSSRARYDEICYFVMTDFEQPLWSIGKHSFALPEEQRVKEMLATAAWEFSKSLTALRVHMTGRQLDTSAFAVGSAFTMADVLLAQTLNWADRFEMSIPKDLIAYRDRMYARAACRRALATVT
ncbi:MAG: glutathione S-transferase family protein [Pseudomonadales bacterium]|jgi:glutathione S-transferase|nr:glutathione S-transferase family protein [Pseudomonadales bacterium]MDP7597907.1 glutathione S-transferase family protein [Pseudomonadales bacterium]HJN49523.1 glutathione S-transferase family protein [Pseudomonadales bacterium]|tara:strand:+ start:403 stop:1035 length:633 start_codon:yes stop_codon:yes gene_type:complete